MTPGRASFLFAGGGSDALLPPVGGAWMGWRSGMIILVAMVVVWLVIAVFIVLPCLWSASDADDQLDEMERRRGR